MSRFLIYTNAYKDKNLSMASRAQKYLELKGQSAEILEGAASEPEDDKLIREKIQNFNFVVVLGGDGTVLQAARRFKDFHIPIIGVNMGTLGYLSEVDPDNLEDALDAIISGDYECESRMMLHGRAVLADGTMDEDEALNDIVITRSGSLRIVNYDIYVNGQFLNEYSADGVIVTTPTGSTGYNLSAGGPIIEPGAKLIMITPVSPHSLNQRSIILSQEDVVEIRIPQGRDGNPQSLEATFDGAHRVPLTSGDLVRITQSGKIVEFIKISRASFMEILHRKMRNS